MADYRHRSIGNNMLRALLVTTACALLLATIAFSVSDWFSSRVQIYQQLKSEAGIIAHNSVAALLFDDLEAAQHTLKNLQSQANIVGAMLYLPDNTPFAHYERLQGVLPSVPPIEDQGSINQFWYVQLKVEFDDEVVGSILLLSDNSRWLKEQLVRLLLACLVFAICLLVAFLIASYLQRAVSRPIIKLAETTRRITQKRDYSLRATRLSDDEIGDLVDDFNEMLNQIQSRDKDLQLIQGLLEQKVEERTRELAELAKKYEHQAYHDALTGLANRITFDNRLQDAISHARRYDSQVSVLFLDLDRFKVVNDTLGHDIGDKLLKEVACRLKQCLREDDTLARLGGDEFAILLTDLSLGATGDVANKISRLVTSPMTLDGHNLTLTTSIGVSVFPSDGNSAVEILKNADTAMYRSKDRGRNRITFFAPDMNRKMERRLVLENKLRQAVNSQLFTLHYQPKVDTNTLAVVGVEALIRWHDLELGQIPTSEFIELAEECGLIGVIDQWVLERACADILSITPGGETPLQLSVNFSPSHFYRYSAPAEIKAVLEKTGFPGHRLELEITENLVGPTADNILDQLQSLRQLEVEISIDDFGTAYSSLSRLKQFPLNTLKIDQSFVHDLGRDPDDETMVKTIITMAHNLNLKVVAEGIETQSQYEFVKQHGCDQVQGYLYSKPMPLAQLQQTLQQQQTQVYN